MAAKPMADRGRAALQHVGHIANREFAADDLGQQLAVDRPARRMALGVRRGESVLRTQYDTVEGWRSSSRAIASIDAPASSRSANHSRSTVRTLVRVSDGLAVVGTNPVVTDGAVMRDELASAIEARRELGDEMEPAVTDAFVSRIERRLAERVDRGEGALQARRDMVLGSMAVSIPLLAIAAISPAFPGSSPSAPRWR
jgi:hypothetical protein